MITKENALLVSMIANEHSFIIGIENLGSCYYYSYHVYLEENEVDEKRLKASVEFHVGPCLQNVITYQGYIKRIHYLKP